MNGKVAKRLRKIARALNLPEQRKFVPGGPLRSRAGFRHPETSEWVEGAPIQRPAVMTSCTRRAAKEAKKVYMGRPFSALSPQEESAGGTDFRSIVSDSVHKFYNQRD